MSVSRHRPPKMSDDPRAERTRMALKQALMQLLQRSDWGEITIVGICNRAGIARSSFYEHFATKSELLDEIFTDNMSRIPSSPRQGDPLGTLSWLVEHVAEAPHFFTHAMAGGRDDALLPRFRAALIRRLEEELTSRSVSGAKGKAAFLIGGAMAYLASAETDGAQEKLQDLAKRVLS